MEAHVRHVAGLRNITLAVRSSLPKPGRERSFVTFKCSFGEKYKPRKTTDERKTKSVKQGCPFHLTGKEWAVGSGPWIITVKNGRHNHAFPMYAEGSRLGAITPEQYAVIVEQDKVNLSATGMLSYLKSTDPGNVTTKRQIYNATAKARAQNRQGRTPIQNFLQNLRARNYRFDVRTVSGSNDLGDIAFSHPGSYIMVNAYPQVILTILDIIGLNTGTHVNSGM